MDRLSALEIFKSVADKGGFSRAAAELEMSCAKVTRSVQELELLLGVQLLQRTTRRVSLTTVGQEVLCRAEGLLDSYNELAALSSLSANEAAGTVRLAAPASLGRHYLGPALAEFMSRYPKIWVDLSLREREADVVADEVDVMLSLRTDLRGSLITRRIASVALGLYAAPSYLGQHGDPLEPEALLLHNCLTCEDTASGTRWRLRHRSTGQTSELPVRGSMRCSHAEVLVEAAVHGAGVVLLPEFMAELAVQRGSLRRLLPDWHSEPLTVYLAYHTRRNQPQRVRKLIDHLAQALGNEASCSGRDAMHAPMREPRALPDFLADVPAALQHMRLSNATRSGAGQGLAA